MSKKTADVMSKLVALLEPLESTERLKAVDAALLILGETQPGQGARATAASGTGKADAAMARQSEDGWPTHTRFRAWMKQNAIALAELEQIYHLEGEKVSVIASKVAGKKGGEKSRNAYLLQGIASLIESGEPAFTDEAARELCTSLGCYDKDNHSIYLRALGNQVTGSKQAGWKLTSPGLTSAATAIKATTANEKK